MDIHERGVYELDLRIRCPKIEELTMRKNQEPWHELIFVCPNCRKEFKPEAVGLHVRLCPDCEGKKAEHALLMEKAAEYATSTRANTSGLLETIVGNR
jgi:hypothetical protein